MKMLVATAAGQGVRRNDFHHCHEGEPVMFSSECDGEAVDGNCGCRRAMAGMRSALATTTFRVVETELDAEAFEALVRVALTASGWIDPPGVGEPYDVAMADQWVAEDARELLRIAEAFEVGDIVEKRGKTFQTR